MDSYATASVISTVTRGIQAAGEKRTLNSRNDLTVALYAAARLAAWEL